ncbi:MULTISPECIES: hypothetical protein [unclassified Lysinibacillus]|uniref:hypothetical protein n=1 Tax=unclassified Lysinibacillus TaxID=2636778 RepID=UPI002011881D|nr:MULTISPECIES: hypothetical protein [unclassified Lysinibacillus]MCL1696255.1 hypothetical protein [Lysinibacillus sp. BPa_S21]MCL1700849.1 hypothetical protein [Lysinibacillus sp. Bpr_S20]
MTNKKSNPVGLSYISQQSEYVNSKEKYYINKEQDKYIYYFPTFGKNKSDELIIELATTINYCHDKNIDFLKNDADVLKYVHFLIIKHFSSLYEEIKDKSFEVHIETLSKMYDTGMYDLFFNEIFNEDEVQKVIDQLYLTEELADKYVKELTEQKEIISKNVNTQLLRDKVLN